MKKLDAYSLGWNAWLESKSQDDNPWTECTDSGREWMRGMMDAEKAAEEIGSDNMEKRE